MKYLVWLFGALILLSCGKPVTFESLEKIDAHFHYNTSKPTLMQQARTDGFKLLTINTGSSSKERIQQQWHRSLAVKRRHPTDIAIVATFSMQGFGEPDWQQQTIRHLQTCFDSGAVAVKVWKDIGMTFRDADSSFIMVDDPRLTPIFDYIQENNKTLVAHCGEPLNCWLPLDSMTTNNDRNYFADNPQYHMHLHPEYPSYDEQIAARDRLLQRHPNLRVVGCHLGSLEYDVDEIAKRLDAYPNFAVDLAARLPHLWVQDRDTVRQFFIRYADRILYGTDLSARDGSGGGYAHDTWTQQWRYFTTADTLTHSDVNKPFVGLDLPDDVLKRIYRDNVYTWLPGFPR